MENIAWYYEVDGACIGPVTQEALCHLLRTGSIGPATRVRCNALPDWMLAAQVPGFQAVASPPPMLGAAQQLQQQPQPPVVPGTYVVQPDPAAPQVLEVAVVQPPPPIKQEPTLPNFPPTPARLPGAPGGPDTVQPNYLVWDTPAAAAHAAQAAAPAAAADQAQGEDVMLAVRPASANFDTSPSSRRVNEENVPQVRPWVRFWARKIDAMVAGFAFAICSLGWAALAGPMGKWTFLLCAGFFVFWMFVEAFMLSEMGTTIGKAVLGVTVRNEEGNDLTYPQALARTIRVWLTCGIPVVNLIPMIVYYFRLTGEGATPWDRDGRLTVSHSRVGVVRGVAAFVCIIGLFWVTMFASSIAASATDPGAPIIASAAAASTPPVPVATIPSVTIPPPAPPPIQVTPTNPDRRLPAVKRKPPTVVGSKGQSANGTAKAPPGRGPAPVTVTRTKRADRTQTASAAPTSATSDQDLGGGGGSSSEEGKIMIIRKTR